MINIIKTKDELNIEVTKLTHNSATKVVWNCNECNIEKIKRYDEVIKGSGLCAACHRKKVAKMMGNKFGKTQMKTAYHCKDCNVFLAYSVRLKYCKICLSKQRSILMSGAANPAWTGKHICSCGEKKSSGAVKCRKCSFKNGNRSVENNGRFIKENREEFINSKKAAKIARSCLANILNSLNIKKNSKTENLLGYSFNEFKTHIESKFEPWMNWFNRGNKSKHWNIDHIIPVHYMISHNIQDPSIINALWNIRPLRYEDNMQKSNSLTKEALILITTKL